MISSSNSNNAVSWVASDLIVVYQAPLIDIYGALLQGDFAGIGAANLSPMTWSHLGQCLDFDVAAASRTCTLPAGATLGHGFKCWVYGYGSTSNGVILTPASGEAFNEQVANATKTILGGVKLEWNDTRGVWIVSSGSQTAGPDQASGRGPTTSKPKEGKPMADQNLDAAGARSTLWRT